MDALTSVFAGLTHFVEGIITLLGSIYCWFKMFFSNPIGFLVFIINGSIDGIGSVLPVTPDDYKLGGIASHIGSALPLLGSGFVREMLVGVVGILSLSVAVRLIKYIPFL